VFGLHSPVRVLYICVMTENKEPKGYVQGVRYPLINLAMIVGGIVMLLLDFYLMSGGSSEDPVVFSEALFSFRRITLAPLVVMGGFVLVGVGIMRNKH
jgi:hypothetical protein